MNAIDYGVQKGLALSDDDEESRFRPRWVPGVFHNHAMLDHLFDVVRSSAELVTVRVGGMLVGLALTVLLARTLPAEEFGVVSIAMSLGLLGGLLITLNVGAGALRFLPPALAHGEPALAASFSAHGKRIVGGSLLLTMCAIGAAWLGGLLGLTPAPPVWLVVGLAAAPAFGWLRVQSANVAALGAVVRAAIPNTLIRPCLMLLLVAGTYWRRAVTGCERCIAGVFWAPRTR